MLSTFERRYLLVLRRNLDRGVTLPRLLLRMVPRLLLASALVVVAAYVAPPDVTALLGGMVLGAFLRQASLAWQASRAFPVLTRVVDRDQVDRLLAEQAV